MAFSFGSGSKVLKILCLVLISIFVVNDMNDVLYVSVYVLPMHFCTIMYIFIIYNYEVQRFLSLLNHID